jgi:hypothetical protein
MRHKIVGGLILFVLLTTLSCFSQQEFVSRYDAYGSYSTLSTPSLNLIQRGFDGEFGWNARRWVALGGDFSVFTGHTTLLPTSLNKKTQAALAPYIPLLVSKGIPVVLPFNSTTYTYSAGPQFNFRKFKAVTLFARPALGALHVSITAQPNNPYMAAIAAGMLGKSMQSSDTVLFYGVGGGMDFNVSKHFGLRTAADFVWYDMFSNLLNGSRSTIRFTVGPTFRFGPNVEK